MIGMIRILVMLLFLGNIVFGSTLNNGIQYIRKYDMAREIVSTFVQLPYWPVSCIKPLTTKDGEGDWLLQLVSWKSRFEMNA